MIDVAREAGVSAQTVSRVMRDHPYVTADKRRRVLAAVERLGYRMNTAAQALSSGRTRTIGVVAMATESYAGSMTQASLERAADELGYSVVGTQISSLDASAISAALRRLERLGSEAIILAVPLRTHDNRIEEITDRLPTATIGGSPVRRARSLAVDQRELAQLATDHLLSLGHETVWHVSGPEDWVDAAERSAGWRASLDEAARPVPDIIHGDWSPESGYAAGRSLGARTDVTAVFVANDEMAFGLIRGLNEAGRRVPADVSVVGVDNIRLAAFCSPALTTVAQPFAELARAAVGYVTAQLEGRDDPPGELTVQPHLVVRASTAPMRGRPTPD
ncbi:LacI family DNA-binding transcriptional regulator [Microbacterium sp. zg.Y1090]|uniref:LacI family DNA-binding transcriptional regulator n=1 Tax=Microbacterium TaxID=33882 RepID=UPI00214C030B|nr:MULTISPECIES: LacI family DNA-binding transcriptional regulator [unclassified Microbacterium]MCR2812310.1 LacI family DNA-binding transcriptional regulator [Microbacterium sp. zg.Y1084]MCR2819800.1 LacI family DNA-binding transcriptional regulator [Microbacterium sp. zg.Y1090]MDL5485467.1 LacI family DNA-binding transcriptional regulator [Microbacterium sp. zg-Y1211]WIM28642.1 LacI family DNA-binding transcriptional regulator [Microbacterium sp. zg-Y1090]